LHADLQETIFVPKRRCARATTIFLFSGKDVFFDQMGIWKVRLQKIHWPDFNFLWQFCKEKLWLSEKVNFRVVGGELQELCLAGCQTCPSL